MAALYRRTVTPVSPGSPPVWSPSPFVSNQTRSPTAFATEPFVAAAVFVALRALVTVATLTNCVAASGTFSVA